MENKQCKIRNNLGQKISFSLEPEGTIMELLLNEFITLELSSKLNPFLELQINQDNIERLYFSIWPEEGTYEVKEFQ